MTITLTINMTIGWPPSGQTEVGDFEVTAKGDENVGRFKVEMNVTTIVNVLDSLRGC